MKKDERDEREFFKQRIMMQHNRQHAFFKRSWMGQRGWIRPTVLSLLEEKPMNGIEIMDMLEEKSKGWWRPSPGSIYPLLEELKKEELVKKRSDGRYEILSRGSEGAGHEELDEVITNIEGNVSYIEDMVSSDRKKVARYSKRLAEIAGRLKEIR